MKVVNGRVVTTETKRKISKANSGTNNGMYGKKHDDTSACISLGFMGHKHSEETKKKLSELKKGRKLSEDHKAKLSANMKEWWRNRKSGESTY